MEKLAMTETVNTEDPVGFVLLQLASSGHLEAARQGQHVCVVCKSDFDAREKAAELFKEMGGVAKLECSKTVHFRASGGTIEFCRLHSESGRRADDFDDHTFML